MIKHLTYLINVVLPKLYQTYCPFRFHYGHSVAHFTILINHMKDLDLQLDTILDFLIFIKDSLETLLNLEKGKILIIWICKNF